MPWVVSWHLVYSKVLADTLGGLCNQYLVKWLGLCRALMIKVHGTILVSHDVTLL